MKKVTWQRIGAAALAVLVHDANASPPPVGFWL